MDPSYNNPPSNPVTPNGVNTGGVFGGGNNGQMNPVGANMGGGFDSGNNGRMSQGDGDIILQADGKKPKKGVIIGVVILLVVTIVVVIIVSFVIGRSGDVGKKDTSESSEAIKSFKEAFNEYANYILYGDDSIEDLNWNKPNEDDTGSFFDKSISSSLSIGEVIKILNKMQILYGTFLDEYSENRSDYIDKLSEYEKKVGLLNVYYSDGIPSKMTLLKSLETDGKDETNNLISTFSDKYAQFDGLYDTDISDLVKNYGDNQLALVRKYSETGCVAGGEIDYSCLFSKDNDEIERLSVISSESLNDIRVIINSCEHDITADLYSLATIVENENIIEDDNNGDE